MFKYFRSSLPSVYHTGLQRQGRTCSCRGFSSSACETCRASWSWHDGITMSWWSWQDEEPNEFACGSLTRDGWLASECTEQLRYICERGMGNCFLYLSVLDGFKTMQNRPDAMYTCYDVLLFRCLRYGRMLV